MKVFLREKKKKKNKILRKEGFIPAVLYGPGIKNYLLKVKKDDFLPLFKKKGESEFFDLEIKGLKEKFSALVREIQRDPLSEEIIHIDFYQPKKGEKIEVIVPFKFINEAPVAKKGGIVVTVMKEVEVKTLPKDVPKEIEVDLSSLVDFDSQIYISDIKFPEGVKPLVDGKTIVVSVSKPEEEEKEEKPAESEAVPES